MDPMLPPRRGTRAFERSSARLQNGLVDSNASEIEDEDPACKAIIMACTGYTKEIDPTAKSTHIVGRAFMVYALQLGRSKMQRNEFSAML